ncbi:hypothetical protein N7490_001462 [Penicillium lividum]|nr:hypothetical protein N7490_001462 [Penicillium lividum]
MTEDSQTLEQAPFPGSRGPCFPKRTISEDASCEYEHEKQKLSCLAPSQDGYKARNHQVVGEERRGSTNPYRLPNIGQHRMKKVPLIKRGQSQEIALEERAIRHRETGLKTLFTGAPDRSRKLHQPETQPQTTYADGVLMRFLGPSHPEVATYAQEHPLDWSPKWAQDLDRFPKDLPPPKYDSNPTARPPP